MGRNNGADMTKRLFAWAIEHDSHSHPALRWEALPLVAIPAPGDPALQQLRQDLRSQGRWPWQRIRMGVGMKKEQDIIEWIAFNDARTTNVGELAASGTVRMGAAILGRTPQYVATEVSRVLTRWAAWRRNA